MKKLFILSLITIIFNSCFINHQLVKDPPIQKVVPMKDSLTLAPRQDKLPNDTSKMIFTIKEHTSKDMKKNNILIDLEFKNISNQSIKLLDLFNDNDLKISLSLSIKSKDGKRIRALGPAIVDFPRWNVFKYILIPENQFYIKTINVSEILKNKNIILSPEFYDFEMIYNASYGKDCIYGRFFSNRIAITVTD